MTQPERPTIYHIEDDPLWAEVIGKKIREFSDVQYLGYSTLGMEGLHQCEQCRADVVLLDLWLPDVDGLLLADKLAAMSGPPKVLLLTARADDFTLFRAMCGKIQGLIWKSIQIDAVLHDAVCSVAMGGTFFPPDVRHALQLFRTSSDAFYKILSNRELDILPSLAHGDCNEFIAAEKGITATTVKSHRFHILQKLGLHTTNDLIRWAAERGFVSFHLKRTCFSTRCS